MGRISKQLFIGGIFLAIVGVLGYGVYYVVAPTTSCVDGIQNQGEEGIDCGTVCGVLCGASLVPLSTKKPEVFMSSESDVSDVMVEIVNSNTIFGATRVDWELVLIDGDGSDKRSLRRGVTYSNPLETRFLVITFPGGMDVLGTNFEFRFKPELIQWLKGRLPESSVVNFSALNEKLVTNENGSVRYTADIRNDSTFDFDEVDVTVILFDSSGKRIGVGATIIRTLVAGQIRAFTMDWPFDVPGEVFRAQIEVSTNVFDNANFIRTYGGQERFQNF